MKGYDTSNGCMGYVANSSYSSLVMPFASGTILSKTAPRTIRRWLRVLRSSLNSF